MIDFVAQFQKHITQCKGQGLYANQRAKRVLYNVKVHFDYVNYPIIHVAMKLLDAEK